MPFLDYNMKIVQGDTTPMDEFKWADENGPVDISTWEIYMTIKSDISMTDAEAEVAYDSTTNPVQLSKYDSAGDGLIDAFVPSLIEVHSRSLVKKRYHIDFQRVLGGEVWTFAMGTLAVKNDVTIEVTP